MNTETEERKYALTRKEIQSAFSWLYENHHITSSVSVALERDIDRLLSQVGPLPLASLSAPAPAETGDDWEKLRAKVEEHKNMNEKVP